MNEFKDYNETIITETDEQRTMENKQRYYWNGEPIKYSVGRDIVAYCSLFRIGYSIENTRKVNTSIAIHTYKIDKDWQEIVKDMKRIDKERNIQKV